MIFKVCITCHLPTKGKAGIYGDIQMGSIARTTTRRSHPKYILDSRNLTHQAYSNGSGWREINIISNYPDQGCIIICGLLNQLNTTGNALSNM